MAVIPTEMVRALEANPYALDAYPDPLPLVVEVWSPSTGTYDMDKRIPGYRQRGGLEIWWVHPYQRTLTAWRRQANGDYVLTVYRGEIVRPAPLDRLALDLDELFTS